MSPEELASRDKPQRLWRNYWLSVKRWDFVERPLRPEDVWELAAIWRPDSFAFFYENDRLELDEFETLVGLHLGVT